MKSKDLWDMRDLPLPERQGRDQSSSREHSSRPSQSVKSRFSGENSSLSDWGSETNEFWNEWHDEFKSEERSPSPEIQQTLPQLRQVASSDMSEVHTADQDLHFEPWAAQLAIHERRLEKEGTADYGVPFRRQEMLAEKTKEYATLLQATFRRHIEVFNQSRKSHAHAIHIYKISRTDEDFLIYRNGVKLIVSGQRAGRITLSFNQFLAPLSQTDKHAHVELEAIWGPFDQLHWSYRGERVELMDVVRYFLNELAFQSFR